MSHFPVPERRRAAVLAGHRGDADAARALLADPDPTVRVAALGALERCGQLAAGELRAAMADADPSVRRRAAEAAAGRPDVDLLAALADADPSVVEMAAWAAGERPPELAVTAALAALATGHRDPLCREAAVAALGALGAPEGLAPVLAALGDRPAVRRRAVLALAAYDGEEVRAALERAGRDRDWQVRQAAEDLLRIDADDGPGDDELTDNNELTGDDDELSG
jgi:HEAT repeat protein